MAQAIDPRAIVQSSVDVLQHSIDAARRSV
jgi:hypothetical protein